MLSILFIDDDLAFSPLIKEYLETQGLQVDWYPHSDTGLTAFASNSYNLCLLDVNMPHKDGFSVANEIREQNKEVPIIFLTGQNSKTDKLQGFDLGADDYITKPMSLELLHARIKAVMRRYQTQQEHIEIEDESRERDFKIGAYTYSHITRELIHPHQSTKLSAKEGKLLSALVQKKGSLLSRDEALNSIWGDNDYSKAMSMNVYISKLRKLLTHDPSIHLLNVHGEGYILNVNEPH
ncbi:MAG: response regulator transcription factor [Bacteroidia bacterium]